MMRGLVRRLGVAAPLVGLTLTGASMSLSPAPSAAVIAGNVMSGTASPMWQTNGTVESVLVSNGVIYAGGSFTRVRPPGTKAGSAQEVARPYLAAFNASTGALVSSFDAKVNGRVKALAVSPDGSRLYLGGTFTSVGGSTRNRVAAVTLPTGSLVTGFNPRANSAVNAVAASGTTVYLGGSFTQIGGVSQPYLASVTTGGAVNATFDTTMVRRPDQPCTPGAFGCPASGVLKFPPAPRAIQLAPDGSRLLVGGGFMGVNGAADGGMASLDPVTGDTLSWAANQDQPINTSCAGRVTDIVVDGGTAFVTGEGDPPGCYEGTYSARVSDGRMNWNASCLGASQALAVLNGVLYKGSHQHDCAFTRGGAFGGYVGGTNRDTFYHVHLLAQDTADGSFVHWSPNTNGAGSEPVGPHAIDAANLPGGTGVVAVGGDFTRVNGAAQQGLARFVTGGDTATPGVPGTDVNADPAPNLPRKVALRLPVTVQATAGGTLTVEVPAVLDPDTGALTYRVYRDGGGTPVATLGAESFPWSRPVLRYDDQGLAPGSTHSYQVTASDGSHTSARSAAVSGTVGSAPPPFAAAYAALDPDVWWRLGDPGPAAADSSPHGHAGTLVGGATAGAAGAVTGDAALALDGSTGYVSSDGPVSEPNAYSEAAWFRTTSTAGGVIVAQSDRSTGAGGTTDRMITMDNNGDLVFAMKAGASGVFGAGTINIRNQGTVWNDGRWHLVVGTYDGNGTASLWVDGWLQGTATGTPFDATAKANGLATSYLRAGYADVSGIQVRFGRNFYNNPWPLGEHFQGALDEVTSFDRALTRNEVAALFAAGVAAGG